MSEDFSAWVGRSEMVTDLLDPARANALKAALGIPDVLTSGAPLPLLYHWLYFWKVRPPAGLGPDGHPLRGDFLPPVPLPCRMWAGGRVKFVKPLVVGERVTQVSTISKVEAKRGRNGNLVLVTVHHALSGPKGVAVTEEQDIVYREAALAGSITAPPEHSEPPNAAWQHNLVPDSVLLFRYSALSMNSHRIHYDRPYAMREEVYPGLVVHGPLQATLLAELASHGLAAPIAAFEYRGLQPAFDGSPLHVCGERSKAGASLWIEQGGRKTMTAIARCGEAA